MYAGLTVRKLKPGTYDEWRKAWETDEWPEGSKKALILRNVKDPDEIIAFGLFEGKLSELHNPKFEEQQKTRVERMAPHVKSTGADGIYEVIEEIIEPSRVTASVGSTSSY